MYISHILIIFISVLLHVELLSLPRGLFTHKLRFQCLMLLTFDISIDFPVLKICLHYFMFVWYCTFRVYIFFKKMHSLQILLNYFATKRKNYLHCHLLRKSEIKTEQNTSNDFFHCYFTTSVKMREFLFMGGGDDPFIEQYLIPPPPSPWQKRLLKELCQCILLICIMRILLKYLK